MAFKTYNAGIRYNEDYYVMPIVYYNLDNPNSSFFSLGIEVTNPQTGNKTKLQLTEPLTFAAFSPVDDFITDID